MSRILDKTITGPTDCMLWWWRHVYNKHGFQHKIPCFTYLLEFYYSKSVISWVPTEEFMSHISSGLLLQQVVSSRMLLDCQKAFNSSTYEFNWDWITGRHKRRPLKWIESYPTQKTHRRHVRLTNNEGSKKWYPTRISVRPKFH